MIVLMMFPSRCSTMWIVGLIIRPPLLRHLLPLPLVWRLPAPRIASFVPSALPLFDGGSFLTPSLPPHWSPVGGGSRRSFGCAVLSALPVWVGVVAVFGGLLGGVLGGCCGLSPLCCSSSSGLGWLLFCSGSLLPLLRCLCADVPSLSSVGGGSFSVLGWGCGRAGVRGVRKRGCRNGVRPFGCWGSGSLRHLRTN